MMKRNVDPLAALSFATFTIGLFLVACSLNSPGHPYLGQFAAVTAVGAASSGYFLLKGEEKAA